MSTYGSEIAISLITCTLLWNLQLISQINFGRTVITRITMLPYYASLIFLVVLLVEAVVQAYAYEFKVSVHVDENHTSTNLLAFLRCLKVAPFVLFISLRTFETAILHAFLGFSGAVRLEFLDIAKPQFTEREERYSTIAKWGLIGTCVGVAAFGVVQWLSPPSLTSFEIEICWTSFKFSTLLMLSHLHLWTNISLLRAMWRKRYYEFKRHTPQQIPLILITQVCIYFLLLETLE